MPTPSQSETWSDGVQFTQPADTARLTYPLQPTDPAAAVTHPVQHPDAASLTYPAESADISYVASIPLIRGFRFAHEPVTSATAERFVGRERTIQSLVQHLLFSEGGSFLLTGYRGVGKTSLVNQVVWQLQEDRAVLRDALGRFEVVDVHLSLARPVTPSELMHYIIRGLYHRLQEKKLFTRLPGDLQRDLVLAYQRTSLNMSRKLSEAAEHSFGVGDLTLGAAFVNAGLKVSAGRKKSRSRDDEFTFLGYDDRAAEYDLIRISRSIVGGFGPSTGIVDRLRRFFSGTVASRTRIKPIFVFDELDKLEDAASPVPGSSLSAIDEILSSLKNLFTTSGICFIFVAGKDLHDRWVKDLEKGDSIYESIFCYDEYLPCLWSGSTGILSRLVAGDALDEAGGHTGPFGAVAVYDWFEKYLAFKGRGIPRLMLRHFNKQVRWEGGAAFLGFTREDVRRIRFYADLQDVLRRNERRLYGRSSRSIHETHEDRQRLGAYYLIDWILRRGGSAFTFSQLVESSRQLNARIAPGSEVAPDIITDLLDVLIEDEYLVELHERPDEVNVVGTQHAHEPRYALSPRRLTEMQAVADAFDDEILTDADALLGMSIGAYRISSQIGAGGMGIVYRAWDQRRGRMVALKVLNPPAAYESAAIRRFEQEARVMEMLDSPDIVRIYEHGREQGRHYIAMELVDGCGLDQVLRHAGRVDLDVAVTVGSAVARALHYVHEQGFVRNDVKPGNILLSHTGQVVLTDFGTSLSRGEDVDPGITGAVGTPYYMAPELIRTGKGDERSDIYALGVTLYEMVTGRRPFASSGVMNVLRAHENESAAPPSSMVSLPTTLESIIMRCLEKDPDTRFATMADLDQALRSVAEIAPADALRISELVGQVQQRSRVVEESDRGGTQTLVFAGMAPSPLAAEMDSTPQAPSPPVPFADLPERTLVVAGQLDPSATTIAYLHLDGIDTPGAATTRAARLKLKGDTIHIGRSSDNDLVLNHSGVSRHHAQLVAENGGYAIEAFNTKNVTWLNDEAVLSRRILSHGDKVRIGQAVLTYEVGDPSK